MLKAKTLDIDAGVALNASSAFTVRAQPLDSVADTILVLQ
jgi:hypothetical protein